MEPSAPLEKSDNASAPVESSEKPQISSAVEYSEKQQEAGLNQPPPYTLPPASSQPQPPYPAQHQSYGQQQPPYLARNAVVVTQPQPVTVVQHPQEPLPSNCPAIALSCFVCWCFFCLFGLIAFCVAGKWRTVAVYLMVINRFKLTCRV